MVDALLFRAVLAALRPGAQLVLVGDVDQLPSVGAGAVLADVIDPGAATVIRLTEIFRQAAASKIVVSAHQINHGELPDLESAAPAATATSTSSRARSPRRRARRSSSWSPSASRRGSASIRSPTSRC